MRNNKADRLTGSLAASLGGHSLFHLLICSEVERFRFRFRFRFGFGVTPC